jgi:hypothetical protein
MKISLITISPDGCIWKTMRDGQIAEGRIQPNVPQDKNGDYIYNGSNFREESISYGQPFSDLPVFFDATPKLEKFFAAMALREFSPKWFGILVRKPVIAVHLVGYSRMIHLGEQLALKECIFRWGGGDAVVCKWPTPYTDTQIREILLGEAFKKKPNQPLQRNASTGSVSNFESPARRG